MTPDAATEGNPKAFLHLLISIPPSPYYILDIRPASDFDTLDSLAEPCRCVYIYGLPLSGFLENPTIKHIFPDNKLIFREETLRPQTEDDLKTNFAVVNEIHGFGIASLSDRLLEALLPTMEILNENQPKGVSWSVLGRSLLEEGPTALCKDGVVRFILKREGMMLTPAVNVNTGIIHCVLNLPIYQHQHPGPRNSYIDAVEKMGRRSRETKLGSWERLLSTIARRKEKGIAQETSQHSRGRKSQTHAQITPLTAGEKVTSWLQLPSFRSPNSAAELGTTNHPQTPTPNPGFDYAGKKIFLSEIIKLINEDADNHYSSTRGDDVGVWEPYSTPESETSTAESCSSSVGITNFTPSTSSIASSFSYRESPGDIPPCPCTCILGERNAENGEEMGRRKFFYERLALAVGALGMVVYNYMAV